MDELKSKIARGEYEVESRKVAAEILAKVRIMRRARRLLRESPMRDLEWRPRIRSRRFRAAETHLGGELRLRS